MFEFLEKYAKSRLHIFFGIYFCVMFILLILREFDVFVNFLSLIFLVVIFFSIKNINEFLNYKNISNKEKKLISKPIKLFNKSKKYKKFVLYLFLALILISMNSFQGCRVGHSPMDSTSYVATGFPSTVAEVDYIRNTTEFSFFADNLLVNLLVVLILGSLIVLSYKFYKNNTPFKTGLKYFLICGLVVFFISTFYFTSEFVFIYGSLIYVPGGYIISHFVTDLEGVHPFKLSLSVMLLLFFCIGYIVGLIKVYKKKQNEKGKKLDKT